MTSEVSQNTITAFYLFFSHNYIVFAYFLGLLLTVFLSIRTPSRSHIFLLLSFAILTFSFEYDKHIIVPFREQTIKSLTTITPHYKLKRLVELSITHLFPMLFYLVGWICMYIGIVIKHSTKTNKSHEHRS